MHTLSSTLGNVFRKVYKGYAKSIERYPTITKGLTAGVLFVAGDVICQSLENHEKLDWGRTMRMGLFGTTIYGPMGHYWYQWLDMRYPKKTNAAIFKKVVLDQVIFTPVIYVQFYSALPLMEAQHLFVGTTEGVLFVWNCPNKPDPKTGNFVVTLVDTQKTFAKKPITQLNAVDSKKILLSLSDGFISVHDLPSLTPRTVIQKSKGCHLYTVDDDNGVLTLCAAIRKKIVIFRWDGRDFVEYKELSIPDSARTLINCGQSICIGFRREYSFIHIQTGNISDVFDTGKSGTPIAHQLPNDQMLLGKDSVSIFIGFDGKPTRKYGLTWSENPVALAYSFPYVLAANGKGIEVRAIFGSQALNQTIGLKSPKFLVANKNGEIYAATQQHVWRLVPIPIVNQVEQLVNDKEYQDALMLCDHFSDSEVKGEQLRKQIKELYAFHLFFQGQHNTAIEYFIELNCDPLRIIGLYPNYLPSGLKLTQNVSEIPELVGAALDKAVVALVNYLTLIRKDLTPQGPTADDYANETNVPCIVDTTLLKAYLRLNSQALVDFLQKPNNCHLKEAEKLLLGSKKQYELMLLYRGIGQHRSALELLSRYGQGKEKASSNQLQGPAETINYLRQLGNQHLDLILEFSVWVLQVAPHEGIKIFTEKRTPPNALLPAKVIAHIGGLNPQLVVPYLEHIIYQEGATEAEYHNELVFLYLDTILNHKGDPVFQQTARAKLISFLETSKYYNPDKMLGRFLFDDLFEERAILFSRIGEHDKALQIYVFKLKDLQKAENYCHKHYSSGEEGSKDVYLALLRVYLDGDQRLLEPALEILNKYYQRIDISKALELFPPTTPVHKLYKVFEAVMRHKAQDRRNNQVVKNLLKSENLQNREALIRTQSRVIKIEDTSMCPVCNKRLGTSVFAFYPQGVVVHYVCRDKFQKNKETR